jgi:hypothetical protein
VLFAKSLVTFAAKWHLAPLVAFQMKRLVLPPSQCSLCAPRHRKPRFVGYRLGHDAIELVLYRWKVAKNEVAGAISSILSSLRIPGVVLIVLCVALGDIPGISEK